MFIRFFSKLDLFRVISHPSSYYPAPMHFIRDQHIQIAYYKETIKWRINSTRSRV